MFASLALLLLLAGGAAHVQTLIQAGRLEEAAQELKKLLAASPSDPALLNLNGILEAQRGNSAAAEASFREALAAAPQSIAIHLNLARLQQQAGMADKALATWRQIIRLERSHAEAHYQIAFLLLHKGDLAGALAHVKKLSPSAQAKPQVLAIKAAAGDTGALADLKRHGDLTEQDILGILPVLNRRKQDAAALELLGALFDRGLAKRPSLEAYAALLEKQKRYAEARKVLEQAAQVEGRADVPLLMALSRLSWQQQDYVGTLSYLGQARELQPDNGAVHFFFGMTAVALDLPVEAKRSLAKAVELDPANPFWRYAYGAVLAQERDASASIPHFEEYVKRRPEDVRGRFALAVAYFLSNQSDEAKERLAPLTQHPETAAGAHYFLGRIARRENRLEDAERELLASLQLLKDQPDALAELGQVYARLQKPELAEQYLTLALKVDPDHYVANHQLLALYQRQRDPRAEQQAARFEEVKKKRSERELALWRTIDIRPY